MIPGIDEILAMLMNDEIDIEQANTWIRAHLARAEDTAHLRDLFAGLAMQGMISHPESDPDKPAGIYARGAYVMADAMMEARNK
jgi:hypothetical protein